MKVKKDNTKLDNAVAKLQKQFGVKTIGKASEMNLDHGKVSTGSLFLDWAVGGGLPLGRIVELYGQYCVDENTQIPYQVRKPSGKPQNNKGGTIKTLYHRFNGIPMKGKGFYQRKQTVGSKFFISSVDEFGGIVKNEVLAVVNAGKKTCYQLSTNTGKKIIASADHRFLTQNNKYKRLTELSVGDIVYGFNGIQGKGQSPQIRYRQVLVKYHPHWNVKIVKDQTRGYANKYYRNKKANAVVEAALNNLSLENYLLALNTKSKAEIDQMQFLDQGCVVHHIDHNSKNDTLDNLKVMSVHDHSSYHTQKNHEGAIRFRVKTETISEIVSVGERNTYDISCQSPLNNYIANGIVTHNSSGKTMIGLFTIAEAQKQGLQCALLDAEKSFDEAHAQRLGVDTSKLVVTQMSEGETVGDIAIKMVEAGFDVIFIDSVSSLAPIVEINEKMEKMTIGLQARLMSKFLKKINAVNKKTLIIFSNQMRTQIGGWSPSGKTPMTTSGGLSLGFYASVRIEVTKGETLVHEKAKDAEGNKIKLGQKVRFKVTKSKVGIPQKQGYFKYIYDPPAIDVFTELMVLARLTGTAKLRGSWVDVLGESIHGKDAFLDKIREDQEFCLKLKEEVLKNGLRGAVSVSEGDTGEGQDMGGEEPERPADGGNNEKNEKDS